MSNRHCFETYKGSLRAAFYLPPTYRGKSMPEFPDQITGDAGELTSETLDKAVEQRALPPLYF
jgi:hypothetical protein